MDAIPQTKKKPANGNANSGPAHDGKAPIGLAAPSQAPLCWQEGKFYAFLHFGINTFTGRETWDGMQSPVRFSPRHFSTDQWCGALAQAGCRGVILAVKHADGFCLWDTAQTDYSVMRSPLCRDILLDLSESCREHGMQLGISLSLLDLHEASYGSGQPYNEFVSRQLTELLCGYGPLCAVILDASREGVELHRKQDYDMELFRKKIHALQPDAALCGDGTGLRLIPYEDATDDALLPQSPAAPLAGDADIPTDIPVPGMPALGLEVSLHPGRFYHAGEADHLVPTQALFDAYINAMERGAALVLHLPPDRGGRISETDCAHLRELGKRINAAFSNNLAADAALLASSEAPGFSVEHVRDSSDSCYRPAGDAQEGEITVLFGHPAQLQYVVLAEQALVGKRVQRFALLADGENVYSGETIGYQKIIPLSCTARRLTLCLLESQGSPILRHFSVYGTLDWQDDPGSPIPGGKGSGEGRRDDMPPEDGGQEGNGIPYD